MCLKLNTNQEGSILSILSAQTIYKTKLVIHVYFDFESSSRMKADEKTVDCSEFLYYLGNKLDSKRFRPARSDAISFHLFFSTALVPRNDF